MKKYSFNGNLSKKEVSTDKGTGRYIHQHITSLVLIPLVLWFCFAIASIPNTQYSDVQIWIAQPINTILLTLFLIAAFYHIQLGLQVIIEDYISTISIRKLSIMVMKVTCFMLCFAGIFSIIKIVL